MSREDNIAAQESLANGINAGDIDTAVQSFAEDVVDHDPAPGQSPGREGFRTLWQTLASAFPDAHIEPAHMVADDDHVFIAYTLTGTHQGDFQGLAATGKRIEVRGVQIRALRERSDRRALGQHRRAGDHEPARRRAPARQRRRAARQGQVEDLSEASRQTPTTVRPRARAAWA